MTTEAQEKKVNDFMVENADKITVKDIKYSIWSPNPHQILNLSVEHRSVIINNFRYRNKNEKNHLH